MFVNNNTKQFCIALPFLLFDRSSLLIIFCRQVGGVFLELKTKFVFYDHCSIACNSFSTSSEHFLRYLTLQLLQIVKSSAYWMRWLSDKIFVMSATHKLKRWGQRVDPCGAPKFVIKISPSIGKVIFFYIIVNDKRKQLV